MENVTFSRKLPSTGANPRHKNHPCPIGYSPRTVRPAAPFRWDDPDGTPTRFQDSHRSSPRVGKKPRCFLESSLFHVSRPSGALGIEHDIMRRYCSSTHPQPQIGCGARVMALANTPSACHKQFRFVTYARDHSCRGKVTGVATRKRVEVSE